MVRNISYIHDYFDIRSYDVYRGMANQFTLGDFEIILFEGFFKNIS